MANAKILVVEDEGIVAADIQSTLKSLGYDVPAIAFSGEEAIKKVEEIQPDLVLMDIVLRGDMDGIQAAEEIHNRFNIPVVYLTAYADDKILQRAKITEPFGYILKPFEERELHINIEIALCKHKVEKALKESEEFSSSLLSNSPNPIIVINKDTSIRYVNPALERLTGFSSEELIGRKSPYPWWPEGRLQDTEFKKKRAEKVEELFQKKNGERFWVEMSSAPIIRDGKLKYYLANWVDTTERKISEECLLQSEKMASIGQLAAGVAHEINNPSTFVNVNAVTMENWWRLFEPILSKATESGWDRELGIEKLSEMLTKFPKMIQSIKEGTARISSITSSLREFARSGHKEKQPVNIQQVIENTIIMSRNQYKYHADLVTENKSEIPIIFGNSQKLEQVFVNLIINATDAIKEKTDIMRDLGQPFKGLISISTSLQETSKKTIEIIVTDNGIGMEPDIMSKIFDPFFTTKSNKKGTGLGISIVYGIVQDHGGKILVESTKEEGSAFTISLPVEKNGLIKERKAKSNE